jgi:hypothetical protein
MRSQRESHQKSFMIPGSYPETLLANYAKPIAAIKIHGALIGLLHFEKELSDPVATRRCQNLIHQKTAQTVLLETV